ncbi:MAG TPA: hypothetical protein VEJ42_02085 [Streptosporangiaceae bacterium]|nr:hypothetical protein [Streptosporangiaceae bacterium]
MHLRPWLSLSLSALVLLAWPAASYASVGVGIQAGPVALAGDAHPGGRYALPPVYVVNTGTEPESVGIRIERISTGTGRTVPPGWVSAASAPVRLAHAQSASIPLELTVPQTAARGRYFSDVVATGSSAIAGGGASFGVAAATDLEFTVAPGAVSHGWFGVPGWLPPFVLAVLVVTAAAVAFRRSGIRIRVEHEPVRMARGRGDDAS